MSKVKYLPGYKEAIYWLDDNYGHFLTPILNMGSPEIDYDCHTAYVTLNPSAPSGFSFRVNPDFVASCSTVELAGVLAHETMHVLLNHLTMVENFSDANKLNIATDCIINDYLTDAGFTLVDGVMRGENIVGFNCALSEVYDVYHAIKDDVSNDEANNNSSDEATNADTDSNADADADADADANDNFETENASGSEDVSSHDSNSDAKDSSENSSEGKDANSNESNSPSACGFAERAVKALEDALNDGYNADDLTSQITRAASAAVGDLMPEDLKEDKGAAKTDPSSGPGTGFQSEAEYAKDNNLSLKWVELLKEINPDFLKKKGKFTPKRRVSYHAPRRKIAAYYPQIILPNYRTLPDPEEKKGDFLPTLVLALDTSSSIPRHLVQTMTSLASSIPADAIHVKCCTFSTRYVEYDITSSSNKIANGGTCFSAVERFIQETVITEDGKYPSAVVVLTDGEAYFDGIKPTSDQLQNNWLWLDVKEHSYSSYWWSKIRSLSGSSRVKKLKEFI